MKNDLTNLDTKSNYKDDNFKYEIEIGKDSPYSIIAKKKFRNSYKEKKWIFKSSSENKSSVFEFYDFDGKKKEYWTTQSPKEHKKSIITELIEEQASNITIKFENKSYNNTQLMALYDSLNEEESQTSEITLIIKNSEHLSRSGLDLVKEWKTSNDARKWKTKIRSLRKKGKLEQYKIDALNKLGMIWHPSGKSWSKDDWEKKYITFRQNGLTLDIKKWVLEQRSLYMQGDLSKENLLRLQAVNFPFNSTQQENYKISKRFIWSLKEKLNYKIDSFKLKQEKKYGIYQQEKAIKLSKDEMAARRKVNGFYNRKYLYCDPPSLNKLNTKEALKYLENINKGISYKETRLKEFLDIESENYKNNGETIPRYVKKFYDEITNIKLENDQIYSELSKFSKSGFDSVIRKQACYYMLKYIPSIRLSESTLFKEVNYLININKKEKNISEIIWLKDYIDKYPALKELYGDKIYRVVTKLKIGNINIESKKIPPKINNCLKILGLDETATAIDIKKTYRYLAKKNHPDKHVGMSDEFIYIAEKKFQKIQVAYNYLNKNYSLLN